MALMSASEITRNRPSRLAIGLGLLVFLVLAGLAFAKVAPALGAEPRVSA